MADHQTVHRARQNGQRAVVHGAPINVDQVIDLLVASAEPSRHPAVRTNANRLIGILAQGPWCVTAGPHPGGFGGGGRGPDGTTHITLRAGNRGYHLRQDARGHLFEITGPGLQDIQPSRAPGSPPGQLGRR